MHTGMFGWTPLHCAARNKHLQVVALLLELGADKAAVADGGSVVAFAEAAAGRPGCACASRVYFSLSSSAAAAVVTAASILGAISCTVFRLTVCTSAQDGRLIGAAWRLRMSSSRKEANAIMLSVHYLQE